MLRNKARWLAGLFLFVVAGCALLPQTRRLEEHRPAGLPQRVELSRVPFFPQEDYQCGPASLAMALNAAGAPFTVEDLTREVYIPGRKGSLQVEMLAATRRHGFVAYQLAPKLEDVLKEVAAGTPVIVLQNILFNWLPLWHYAVVIGYDLGEKRIILHSGLNPQQKLPMGLFEYTWQKSDYWAMVAVPPDKIPATASEEKYAVAVAALEQSGHARAARIAYQSLLERWPKSLAGEIGLGNTAYALGDLAAAEAAFRKAARDHPDSAAALNNWAQALADQGRLAEAREAAQEAVRLGGPLLPVVRATLEEIEKKIRGRPSALSR